MNYTTLTEAFLDNNSSDHGIFHVEGEEKENFISYSNLQERAKGLLGLFQRKGIRAGSQLIISVTKNEQFIDSFWASILGRITPVPVAFGISDEHRAKIFRIFEKLDEPFIFLESANLKRLGAFAEKNGLESQFKKLSERSVIVDEIEDLSQQGSIEQATPEDIAFIQFSSGSTSEPKGVVLTHENVITNVLDILSGIHVTQEDSTISWMPLTHDMGLIGFHLCELVQGINQTLLPTELFIRRPLLWMQLASEKKITVTCSPNFGYKHFLKAYSPEKLNGADLSSIRVIFNGAEPISTDICDQFLDTLEANGLNKNAMFPVYGLAEASLAVTFPQVSTGVRTLSLNPLKLGVGDEVELVGDHQNSISYVIEGKPIRNTEVQITNTQGEKLSEDTIGQVEIRGKNVTKGYYKAEDINKELINGEGWVNTGDLGFIHEGELVITGRNKDIIFVNGQNFYPHDLENIIIQNTEIDLGKIAFVGIRLPNSDGDKLVGFVLHKGKAESFIPVLKKIKTQIAKDLALEVDDIVPVTKIPKTTSGKIQRFILTDEYQNGIFSNISKEINQILAEEVNESKSSGKLELELLNIAKEFITEHDITVDDNIFEIGTSSLTLAQIHERIEERYPNKLEVTDFFDYPTIKDLAKFLEEKI
ncbi:MAG: non-ribosomal peptide synthetase [Bacteroidota bacterium]